MSDAASIGATAAAVLFSALVLAMAVDVYVRRRELWRDEDEGLEDEDDTPPPVS